MSRFLLIGLCLVAGCVSKQPTPAIPIPPRRITMPPAVPGMDVETFSAMVVAPSAPTAPAPPQERFIPIRYPANINKKEYWWELWEIVGGTNRFVRQITPADSPNATVTSVSDGKLHSYFLTGIKEQDLGTRPFMKP